MDVPVIADLLAIRERRNLLINDNLQRQNRKRYDYNYRVGEAVYVKTYDPSKLGDEILHGPYQIVETKCNGTVIVALNDNASATETFNLKKVVPS